METEERLQELFGLGSIVYTKKVAVGPKFNDDLTMELKKPMAAIALGIPSKGTLDLETSRAMIAEIGLIQLEDTIEALGKEQAKKLFAYVVDKYKADHLSVDWDSIEE